MSRRTKSVLQFGSDSFLDVVCNIVGILIILIVIAGLRLSRMPRQIAHDEGLPPQVAEACLEEPLEPLFADEPQFPSAAPGYIAHRSSEPPSRLEPPPELVRRMAELKTEASQLESRLREAAESSAHLKETTQILTAQISESRRQAQAAEKRRLQAYEVLEVRKTSFDQLQATAIELQAQVAEEEKKAPLVKTLEHRVTPLSREVSGNEQHYRLAGNRVSEVPIAALSVRLRDQIERRKDWLMKQASSQGEVGPIGGYAMHYRVLRESGGMLDEVRFGQGVVRISVANWRIEPVVGLPTESAQEALAQGSMFYNSLMAADEGTSLTFWVYPDSFELYRHLQEFAHKQGFLVAGRPLPQGIPISGSPSGSKSAGH